MLQVTKSLKCDTIHKFCFQACAILTSWFISNLRYRTLSPIIETSFHLHVTKSPNRDNIYKLSLWMFEEHNA